VTRAFVAVAPPPAALDAVGNVLGRLEVPGARITRRDQWHLTLQFLGNRVELDPVVAALGELALRPASVQLGDFGGFPSERRGRVLWLGVLEGRPFLAQLVAAVGALLGPLGYPPEDREYHPHLTLARWKKPADLREAVAALETGPVGPAWTVNDVVLFESFTRSTGAEHVERGRFSLG
jgi:RNA 2',3'-cyclic 3'-phosphodiesterase